MTMRGTRIKISQQRYQDLSGPSWPTYDVYCTDPQALDPSRYSQDAQHVPQEITGWEYHLKSWVDNIDVISEHSYSQASQDLFVAAMTRGRKHGTWLEFGANDPYYGSNTWFLERHLSWSGVSVEIRTPTPLQQQQWQSRQGTDFVLGDALQFEFDPAVDRYDYLSMDIDDDRQVQLLSRALEHHRFSVITYETDWYLQTPSSEFNTAQSRRLLQDHGYIMVVNGVTVLPWLTSVDIGRPVIFEDWWVDPTVIDADLIQAYQWITPDDIHVAKYPAAVLFANDPHHILQGRTHETV